MRNFLNDSSGELERKKGKPSGEENEGELRFNVRATGGGETKILFLRENKVEVDEGEFLALKSRIRIDWKF